jgi:hypothetical protein
VVVEVEVEAEVDRTGGDLTRAGMMAMVQLEAEDKMVVVEAEAEDYQGQVSMVEEDEKAEGGPTCLLRWPE